VEKFYKKMPITKKIIRVGLLLIMIILGLMVVFPQTPDLIDLIIAENTTPKNELSELYDRNLPKEKSGSFNNFFSKNIAPNRDEIKDYLLSMRYTKKVECIGKIPKIIYDKKKNKTSPRFASISFQVITQSMNTPQLKSGTLSLKAKLHSRSYGHLLSWLDSNRFEGWNYKVSMRNGGELFSQTRLSEIMSKVRIKKCSF